MKFKLKCRIDRTDFYNNKHIANVSTPAPDQYSKPNSFKIYSERALGNVGDEIDVMVAMTGFIREKKYNDKATGQQKTYYEDVTFLNFVEQQQQAQAKAG